MAVKRNVSVGIHMTSMTKTTKRKRTKDEIDALVVAEADDDSAWEEPIQVKVDRPVLSKQRISEIVARGKGRVS